MKILRITVKNIASLAGLQTVDFTREPLKSAGLFAISGATGSGKSSLLDAVCLALFDTAPRLQQIGHLEEIHSGEKQNNSRTILRRGTASGFAEVAFVGVDQQTWTAHWSVRRSRNRIEGKLQPAEMTLYRGNVFPGQDGPIEVGGRKTLVQQAIVEKVGLNFEQFTRAVLLAQNEFAAFLKAGDKERAEILQALTGTERFERISRAVFARAADEKEEVKKLQTLLEGNEPLPEEERRQAERDAEQTRQAVRQLESKIEVRRQHTAWFEQEQQARKRLTEAEQQKRSSILKQQEGRARRRELEQTELAQREARTLWKTHQDARSAAEAARMAVEQATTCLDEQSLLFQQAAEQLTTARQNLEQVRTEQTQQQLLLRTARELDAQLLPLTERETAAEQDAVAAEARQRELREQLDAADGRKQTLTEEEQKQQRQLESLAEFDPFVSDSAKWHHLLQEAVEYQTAAKETSDRLKKSTSAWETQNQAVETRRNAVTNAETEWQMARQNLQSATAAESEFDAATIAGRRDTCDQNRQVLQTLDQQLKQQQRLTDEQETVSAERHQLQQDRQQQSKRLQNLSDTLLPEAIQNANAAESLLQRLETALDDHAQRLRTALQDEEPCPVCGSCEHPYQTHQPDADTIALTTARDHLQELRNKTDSLKAEQTRLTLTIEASATRIQERDQQQTILEEQLQSLQIDNQQNPLVADILAAVPEERAERLQQQIDSCETQLTDLRQQAATLQDAANLTAECRTAEQSARVILDSLRQELTTEEKRLADCRADLAAHTSAADSADKQRKAALIALGDLWSGLPDARRRFDADPQQFSAGFASSTQKSRQIANQLTSIRSELQKLDSGLAPRRDALRQAEQTAKECTENHSTLKSRRAKLLQERGQLFDGQPADTVEADLKDRCARSESAVEQQVTAHHQQDKNQQAARQNLQTAVQTSEKAESAAARSEQELELWLGRFNTRDDCQRTMADLPLIMSRDNSWLAAEKQALKQLDDAVIKAESTQLEREQQLEEHLLQRPTDEEHARVLEALAGLQTDLQEAKKAETAAAAQLRSDDHRRQQNQQLTTQLTTQEKTAAPWLKLNELIGSREGDRFRMIAQRRTLDILLRYANHHLRLLAIRYRLERLPESLNLIVVDEQMGDERRSVHSLSGGESFLVSLSLALGLASLTSSRMKIESLFIDEGFGSLDPETLNTAMGALMQLEAQGRRVGVISHVAELTEAIPVQVHVIRRQGGAARIEVMGAENSSDNTESNDAAGAGDSSNVAEIATRITAILEREQGTGSRKVSLHALRKELGCDTQQLKAAQQLISSRVTVEGRSLRLL